MENAVSHWTNYSPVEEINFLHKPLPPIRKKSGFFCPVQNFVVVLQSLNNVMRVLIPLEHRSLLTKVTKNMEDILHELTEEMIAECQDPQELITWRRELKMVSNRMKARMQVLQERFDFKRKETQSKFVITTDARSHAIAKMDRINQRLRELRGTVSKPKSKNFSQYAKYLKAFKAQAKEILSEEQFEVIDNAAREASGWRDADMK